MSGDRRGGAERTRWWAEVAAVVSPDVRTVLVVGSATGLLEHLLAEQVPERRIAHLSVPAPGPVALQTLSGAWAHRHVARDGLDAVVLAGPIESAGDPEWLLERLRGPIRRGGQLVAVVPLRHGDLRSCTPRSAADASPTTRSSLAALIRDGGWDLTSLTLLPDTDQPAVPLWLDGLRYPVRVGDTVAGLTPVELEERQAVAALATATRPRTAAVPEVSVVVAVGTEPTRARGLVEALLAEVMSTGAEIIVVCDRPDSPVADDLDALPAPATVVRYPWPLGAVEARNAGARAARGRYLVFMESTHRPEPGWLSALVGAASAGVGAVVNLQLDADGAVLSGGLGLGPDLVPGTNLPFPLCRGASRRVVGEEVRAVSAGAGPGLLVPRSLFVEGGGFDPRFTGAFADVDLCLRLRSRGLGVVCAPRSAVKMTEHPPAAGAAAPAPGDRQLFVTKWNGRLAEERWGIGPEPNSGTQRPRRQRGALPLVWTGRFFDGSGIAGQARAMVGALDRAGLAVHVDPTVWGAYNAPVPPEVDTTLRRLVLTEAPERFVHVMHGWVAIDPVPPVSPYRPLLRRHPRSVRSIARPISDADSVPADMVQACNDMDEVWAISRFNRDVFAASGVDPAKIHVVPECLDTDLYRRRLRPLEIGQHPRFVFLSVLYWDHRKGLDVLVRAYFEEFGPDDAVALALKLSPALGQKVSEHKMALDSFIGSDLGADPAGIPPVVIVDRNLSAEGMARLYRAADAFVLASRGEAWGQAYLEAMASGLPAIGTRWGGPLDFMNDDNSYLLDCTPAGGRATGWAEPSVDHLRALMRRVVTHRDEAADRGRRARAEVLAEYGWDRAARRVLERLETGGVKVARRPVKMRVRWEGPQREVFGMAVANRHLCHELSSARHVELALARDSRERQPASEPAAVTVRSSWPPDLSAVAQGKLVVHQPWEFGSVPRRWIAALGGEVDEMWVPSRWVRDCYLRSGADPSKVAVVPLGCDPASFRPDVAPRQLPTDKSWRFLFVGGTLPRKGIDAVVDAYLSTFGPEDDVCLVVKDMGTASFYRGQGLGQQLRELAADTSRAQIVYLDDDMTDDEMPGLYTACHCLVHPYRGEGFGLPIVEAMACGLPVIAPNYGPVLDFCDPSTGILLPTTELRLSEHAVGGIATAGPTWFAEVDRPALSTAMARLASHPDEARALGLRASERVRVQHTWAVSASVAEGRLRDLTGARRGHGRRWRGPRLSVCMVVRDAEQSIATALASIEGLSEDVVVLDTGSSDATREIARRSGALVRETTWSDDFSAARNRAVDLASGSWVFMLDADQELDSSSRDEVRRLSHCELPWGFLCRELNYTGVSGDERLEHLLPRLFPKHPYIRFRGRVHEQLVATHPGVPFQLAPTQIVLHHHGHRPHLRQALAKSERDRMILEEMVRDEPGNPLHAYYLATAYRVLGRAGDAAQQLERALRLWGAASSTHVPQYVVSAQVMLATDYLAAGNPARALEHAQAALRVVPDLPDACFLLGAVHAELGNHAAALYWYRAARRANSGGATVLSDSSTATWRPLVGEAEVFARLGRYGEAEDCLQAALATSASPVILEAVVRLRQLKESAVAAR